MLPASSSTEDFVTETCQKQISALRPARPILLCLYAVLCSVLLTPITSAASFTEPTKTTDLHQAMPALFGETWSLEANSSCGSQHCPAGADIYLLPWQDSQHCLTLQEAHIRSGTPPIQECNQALPYQTAPDGFPCGASKIMAALREAWTDLTRAVGFGLVSWIQCIVAVHTDHQICSHGLARLATDMGFMAGWYLRCLLKSQQRRTAYIQPGERLAHLITICQARNRRLKKPSQCQLCMYCKQAQALMLTMPTDDLTCTAILFSAICIGIVSQTYPVICYCSSFGLAGIVMIMNSQTWQSCWQKARHFTSDYAGLIALLIENVGWALILSLFGTVAAAIIFFAVTNVSATSQHSHCQNDSRRLGSNHNPMGMCMDFEVSVLGGGGQRTAEPGRGSDVWEANSLAWLSNHEIHDAIVAAQIKHCGTEVEGIEVRRFVDYRRMYPTSHTFLLRDLDNFGTVARQILVGEGTEHVSDTITAIVAALHCGVATNVIFSDNAHWRCIHFDPVRQQILCMDPYGNGNTNIKFRQDVKRALERVVAGWCPSWTVRETTLRMQHMTDGHSCGIWVIWMADEWLQYLHAGLANMEFEDWLQRKLNAPHAMGIIPKQDILRVYYGQLIAETPHMNASETRPLFRPTYFLRLYAYWLRQRNNIGEITQKTLQAATLQQMAQPPAGHVSSQDCADAHDTNACSEPDFGCHHQDNTARHCKEKVNLISEDGRQGMGNSSIAPITKGARKSAIDEGSRDTGKQGMPRATIAAKVNNPRRQDTVAGISGTVKCRAKQAPAQPCKKQRRLDHCWAPTEHAPSGRAAATPSAETPPESHPSGPSFRLKVLTWNVMGLTTVKEELEQLLQQQDPDIIVLTETKLTDRTQRKSWLNGILKTHWLQFSSSPHPILRQGERVGSGGVAIAVRKTLVPEGCYIRLPVQSKHRSHLLQVLLQPPNSTPILLQAVYMPFDLETRAGIYEAIKEACSRQLQYSCW